MFTMDRHGLLSRASGLQIPMFALCGGVFLMLLLFALWRFVQYYPENHWLLDIRWLYLVCLFGYFIVSVSWFHSGASKMVVLNLIVCTLLFALILSLDHFNLLVEYDVWLKRGMPTPFH